MKELFIEKSFNELNEQELAEINGGIIMGGPGLARGTVTCMSFLMGFVCGFLSL